MKSMKRISKIAALILVPVCLAVAVALVFSGGSSIAFAEVREKIRNVQTMTCKLTLTFDEPAEGQPKTQTIQIAVKEPGLMRQVHTGEVDGKVQRAIAILDTVQNKTLMLIEGKKIAVVGGKPPDDAKSWNRNLIAKIKRIIEGSDETLGEKEIDGRKAKGFRVISDDQEMDLWVDAKTGDPIQIEFRIPGLGFAVMSEIKFDVELDDSLFDLTPPEGYKVQNINMPGEHSRGRPAGN